MDNLHPYDGVTRRFRDNDTDPARVARGRGLVKSLLRLPELPSGLRYDFSFLSDGSGVFDRLYAAFSCAMDEAGAIGNVFSLLRGTRLPVSYVMNGQNVPDDIEVADRRKLARRILAGPGDDSA